MDYGELPVALRRLTRAEMASLLASLDWGDIGAWPAPLRAALMVALFATASAVGGWGVFGGMSARHDALEAEERALRSQLESSAAQVAGLNQLRAQGKALETAYAERWTRLFAASETAGLIEDITAAAEANHLAIDGIELADSKHLNQYAELPMSIRVVGGYHQLGAFVGSLANLPRVLTLHDFEIEPGASSNELRMRIDLKTYQPVEEP